MLGSKPYSLQFIKWSVLKKFQRGDVLLFRKLQLRGCFKTRRVTKRDAFLLAIFESRGCLSLFVIFGAKVTPKRNKIRFRRPVSEIFEKCYILGTREQQKKIKEEQHQDAAINQQQDVNSINIPVNLKLAKFSGKSAHSSHILKIKKRILQNQLC